MDSQATDHQKPAGWVSTVTDLDLIDQHGPPGITEGTVVTRLTIVIPALGTEDSFETTILSVLECRPVSCEILVPQCGDYADPYQLSDEVTFIEQPSAASGVDLINAGLRAARGEFIHLLAAGASVTTNWAEWGLAPFEDRLIGSVSPLLLNVDQSQIAALGVAYGAGGQRRLVASGKKYSAERIPKAKVLGPTGFAGFYRRKAIEEVGGWSATVGDTLADVDLALSLSALGWTNYLEPEAKVMLDESQLERQQGFAESWYAERLFWRHASATGWLKSMFMHPFTVSWESLTALPRPAAFTQPLGRLLAMTEVSRHLRYQSELQEAALATIRSHEEEAEGMVLPLKRPEAEHRHDDRPLRRVS